LQSFKDQSLIQIDNVLGALLFQDFKNLDFFSNLFFHMKCSSFLFKIQEDLNIDNPKKQHDV